MTHDSAGGFTRVAVTGLVAVHVVVVTWHGHAHANLGVRLPPDESGFVDLVVVAAPIVAGLLVWTRRARIAVWIFVLSMLASFLFGAFRHFGAVSSDHVLHLPSGSSEVRTAFVASAAALAFVELLSVLVGVRWLRRRRDAERAAPRDLPGAVPDTELDP